MAGVDESTCRICAETAEEDGSELISPCSCRGTMQYVHASCLQKALQARLELHRTSWQSDRPPLSTCDVCHSKLRLAPHILFALPDEIQRWLEAPFNPYYIASRIHGALRVWVAIDGFLGMGTALVNFPKQMEETGRAIGLALSRKYGFWTLLCVRLAYSESPFAGLASILPYVQGISEVLNREIEVATNGVVIELITSALVCLFSALSASVPHMPSTVACPDIVVIKPITYAVLGSIAPLITMSQQRTDARLPTMVHLRKMMLYWWARVLVAEACNEGVYVWLAKQVKVVMRGLSWSGEKATQCLAKLRSLGASTTLVLPMPMIDWCSMRVGQGQTSGSTWAAAWSWNYARLNS